MKYFFYYTLLFIIGISFLGCTKNQKLVNELDGRWKLISLYISDQNIETDLNSFTFSSCSLNKEEKCPLQIELKNGNSFAVTYGVDRQQNLLFITDASNSSNIEYSIAKLTKKTLVLSQDYINQAGEIIEVKSEYFFLKE